MEFVKTKCKREAFFYLLEMFLFCFDVFVLISFSVLHSIGYIAPNIHFKSVMQTGNKSGMKHMLMIHMNVNFWADCEQLLFFSCLLRHERRLSWLRRHGERQARQAGIAVILF